MLEPLLAVGEEPEPLLVELELELAPTPVLDASTLATEVLPLLAAAADASAEDSAENACAIVAFPYTLWQ